MELLVLFLLNLLVLAIGVALDGLILGGLLYLLMNILLGMTIPFLPCFGIMAFLAFVLKVFKG